MLGRDLQADRAFFFEQTRHGFGCGNCNETFPAIRTRENDPAHRAILAIGDRVSLDYAFGGDIPKFFRAV